MSNLTYLTCEHCRQEFPFTDQDRELAPMLVDLHLRLHLEICPELEWQTARGIRRLEIYLQQCPYIRLGGPGVKWRCVRYGCTGEHQMERES